MIRKLIIGVILALTIFLCYTTVANGLTFGERFEIYNFKEVENASRQIDTLISQLVNVNDVEFQAKKQSIQSAIKSYKSAKDEYEEMAAMVESANKEQEVDLSIVDIYDIDFLWTVIGNYGTEEGVTLKFDIVKSATSVLSSTEYTICDLKFTVSGDYIPITEFIYHLEDDNKLGFEITDFEIAKGGKNLQATFTAKNVPINNRNLLDVPNAVDEPVAPSTDANGNTVTTTSTTSNTNTTNP